MKLASKTVLITGASSGIGRAVALRCAKDGAHIILSARNEEKLHKVQAEVESLGGTATVIPADVTKSEQVKELFLQASKEHTIDVAFANAGLGHIASLDKLTIDQIDQMIAVNISGAIYTSKYAAEVMTRQQSGHIIITSSLAGLITLPDWSVYVASKWAMTGFTDSIRHELKPQGINVTRVHPGAVKTEFFDEDKANIDISTLGSAVSAADLAEKIYQVMLTDKQHLIYPAMASSYAKIARYLPGLANTLIAKQAEDVDYHEDLPEDEPEFDEVVEK